MTNYNTCDVKACRAKIATGENYSVTLCTKYGDSFDRDLCVKCYNGIQSLLFNGWSEDDDEE